MAIVKPSFDVIAQMKPAPTEGEFYLLNFLASNLSDEYEIFFQPFLNGDRPDLILMRKGGGVLIFEVKDWDLTHHFVTPYGKWMVETHEGTVAASNPTQQVLKYKKNLYDIHIEDLVALQLRDSRYWRVVECVLYFHRHETSEVLRKCLGVKPDQKYKTFFEKNIHVFGRDINKKDLDDLLEKTWVSRKSYLFTDELYLSFSRIFNPSLHYVQDGEDIHLSDVQEELSKSTAGARKRIKGIAGSGKTLVLAKRAVNAYVRTKSNILILTYNKTLRNFIHDKISLFRENFQWGKFIINHYHSFIVSELNNSGFHSLFNEYGYELFENVGFFIENRERFHKYDVNSN